MFFIDPIHIDFPIIIEELKSKRKWFRWYRCTTLTYIQNELMLAEFIHLKYNPKYFYHIYKKSGISFEDLVKIQEQLDKLDKLKHNEFEVNKHGKQTEESQKPTKV